jgi:hypothetical protein
MNNVHNQRRQQTRDARQDTETPHGVGDGGKDKALVANIGAAVASAGH